jgi:hypothetical protein
MTNDEQRTLYLIVKHKESIAIWLAKFCAELAYRNATHDNSKYSEEEFGIQAACVDDFEKYEFNSPEELKLREKLLPGTTIHRKRNRHHPEHFENGIDGMNLIDLLEMIGDWKSASERVKGDSLRKSVPILKEKYNISPQLLKIIENTLKDFNMY